MPPVPIATASPAFPAMPWPVQLACVALAALVVVAVLLYAIVKRVIDKADADDLPQVLAALRLLVDSVGNVVTRPPLGTRPVRLPVDPPRGQTGAGEPMASEDMP
ncbi:hypothetical protein Skr01_70680 [Sphaerisporangium krabiense]|nr:hypothetical protein Skr01_70680 [Sphaerisporangium krabiense]